MADSSKLISMESSEENSQGSVFSVDSDRCNSVGVLEVGCCTKAIWALAFRSSPTSLGFRSNGMASEEVAEANYYYSMTTLSLLLEN